MATPQLRQLENQSGPTDPVQGPTRSCDAHRDRAGINVPAEHFVSGQAFCARCFRGEPIRDHESGLAIAARDPVQGPTSPDVARQKHLPEFPLRRRKAVRGAPLGRRERQIVEMVASGRLTKEISAVLGITQRTVKYHISEALAKSGTRSRVELVAWFASAAGAGVEASIQIWMKRAERDLEQAHAALSKSAGDALNRLKATSLAQQRLEQLELAFAALTEAAHAWEVPSHLDERLQHPRGASSHLARDKSPETPRNL